jgi:hypothetical protein
MKIRMLTLTMVLTAVAAAMLVQAEPKMKPPIRTHGKGAADDTPKPTIRVDDTKLLADGRTVYTVVVTNVDRYPSRWFVKGAPALPPNPCGDSRMQALIYVIRGNTRTRERCEALQVHRAFESVKLVLTAPLENDDRIQLVLEDRLLEARYASEPYSAGWLGVGPLLASAGCKSFLGRASSYLCDAKGFTACENLRKAGKPIACTQAGKKN